MLREGVRQLLESAGDFTITATAEDGLSALSLTRELRPDVLLLSTDLPGLSWLQVLEGLDAAPLQVRTLLFGGSMASTTLIDALAVGALGVLQHDHAATLLFKSIRGVAKGEYWLPRAFVGDLARRVQLSSTPFRLTLRERQVVSLVVAGYSNKDIADRHQLSPDTVKHHLTSIFAKTNTATRVELAVFALHHGIAGREPVTGTVAAAGNVPVQVIRAGLVRDLYAQTNAVGSTTRQGVHQLVRRDEMYSRGSANRSMEETNEV